MAGSGSCHLGDTMPFKLHPYGPHDLSASSPVGVVQVCNHIPKENAEDLGVRDGCLVSSKLPTGLISLVFPGGGRCVVPCPLYFVLTLLLMPSLLARVHSQHPAAAFSILAQPSSKGQEKTSILPVLLFH